VRQELVGNRAIYQTVIEPECQIRHRPNGHRIIDDDRPLLNVADAQNGNLWLMDDRQPEKGT
jgi:hypothetical protein